MSDRRTHPLYPALRRAARFVRPALRGGARVIAKADAMLRPVDDAPEVAPRVAARDNQVRPPSPEAREIRRSLPMAGRPSVRGTREAPRILLLNPPRFEGITVFRMFRSEYLFVEGNNIPPMDLAYFAAAVRGIATVAIVDANAEDLSEEETYARVESFAPDVIVVKGIIDVLDHELAVPLRYRSAHRGVQVVLACRGAVGCEAKLFDELPALDAIACGEIDAFAEDIAEGRPLSEIEGMSTPDRIAGFVRVVEDLDRHPIPDLEVMPPLWGTAYRLPYYGVKSGYFLVSSRGCPYTCTFCMVGGVDDRPFRYRRRDPKNVVEEITMLGRRFGHRDFYVLDEIFTSTHGQAVSEAFVSAGLDLHWLCEGKPDLVTRPILDSMREAGCKAIYYGIESGDDAILSEVQKGHTVAQARRALTLTADAGIQTAAYVMVGFPGESWSSYLRTLAFLMDTRPDFIRYGFLAPYPITVLHRQMREAGLLTFDREGLDRRISPFHDAKIAIRSRHVGSIGLRAMDFLFKQIFADELVAAPPPSRPPGSPTTSPASARRSDAAESR